MIARHHFRPAVLGCALAALALACDKARPAREEVAASDAMMGAPGAPPPPVAAAPERVAGVSMRPGSASAPGETSPQPGSAQAAETASVVASAMLIRNGNASIEVDSLEPAIAAVQALAARLGGYVANTNLQTGEGAARQAVLDLRLPSARFDDATGALEPIGKVESLAINTTDVGEEFVDIQARVANARRLEERLIGLLATRTGKLEEVLAVERELARVREEIERYDGRLRYLRTRVSLSTLTVVVHEPRPVIARRPGPSPIGEAFRDAWRNFVGFLAGLIAMLGWLLPLAAIVGAIVWAGRRWIPRPSATPRPPLG